MTEKQQACKMIHLYWFEMWLKMKSKTNLPMKEMNWSVQCLYICKQLASYTEYIRHDTLCIFSISFKCMNDSQTFYVLNSIMRWQNFEEDSFNLLNVIFLYNIIMQADMAGYQLLSGRISLFSD